MIADAFLGLISRRHGGMAEADFFGSLLEKRFESVEADAGEVTAGLVTGAFEARSQAARELEGVDADHLIELLMRRRFSVESHCEMSRTLVMARASFASGLYESITVQSAGQKSHVVQARIGVWFGRHGIVCGQSRLLTELAPHSRTGILMVRDAEAARRAECRIAHLAPSAVEIYARNFGLQLLARLSKLKPHVEGYLRRIGGGDVTRNLSRVNALANADQIEFARRLLEIPGVQRTSAPVEYRLAALSLAVFGEEVEGNDLPFLYQAMKGAPLMLRLQLIVHQLIENGDR
jgi:hypothetical protein